MNEKLSQVLALSGGVGGAKLALGLSHTVRAEDLCVAVNVGDDFQYLGLVISPDLDAVLYTLSGVADPQQGWGRADESWQFMAEIERLGAESWFRIGDKDLAIHIERTRRLRRSESLSAIAEHFARRFGIASCVVPISNDSVRTILNTDNGVLDFQEYFVHQRCKPRVAEISFEGATTAHVTPKVLALLDDTELRAVVVCPSNPYLSIDPMLAIPGLRSALAKSKAPIVAVSPLIGKDCVKGPTAKIMRELGHEISCGSIVAHYKDLIDGIVVDAQDAGDMARLAIPFLAVPTFMNTLEDKVRLARHVLEFAESLRGK